METFKLLCNGNPIGEYQGDEMDAIHFFTPVVAALDGLGNKTEIVTVKPEPVPFTIEDAHLFRDRWVGYKNGTSRYRIGNYDAYGIYIKTGCFAYSNALKYLKFDNGESFGK